MSRSLLANDLMSSMELAGDCTLPYLVSVAGFVIDLVREVQAHAEP